MRYELIVTITVYVILFLVLTISIYFSKIKKETKTKDDEIRVLRYVPGQYLFFMLFNLFLTIIIVVESVLYWLLLNKNPLGLFQYIMIMIIFNLIYISLNIYTLSYKIVIYRNSFKVYRFFVVKEFKYVDVSLYNERYGFYRVIKDKLPVLNCKNIKDIEFLDEMIKKQKEIANIKY